MKLDQRLRERIEAMFACSDKPLACRRGGADDL